VLSRFFEVRKVLKRIGSASALPLIAGLLGYSLVGAVDLHGRNPPLFSQEEHEDFVAKF
jgi:hypothetical protein